jgi:hypothetical protein
MNFTGTIHNWHFLNDRVYGRMEDHARTDLNGRKCHTNIVVVICADEAGNLVASTQSGSIYKLVDPILFM